MKVPLLRNDQTITPGRPEHILLRCDLENLVVNFREHFF